MDDPKAFALFQEILKRTDARKLAWEMTRRGDEYAAPMMKYQLKLLPYTSLSNWGEWEGPPVLTLNDENGNMLVEMSVDVDGITPADLKRMVTAARRIALNIDDRVDELLTELRENDDK